MSNFRKAYYASLGVRPVEVKLSVEAALHDPILDIPKLNKLCLWIRIPHLYRPLVWKVLLRVIPTAKRAWEYVSKVRHEQYQFLRSSLSALLNRPHWNDDDLSPEMCVKLAYLELDSGENVRETVQRLDQKPESFLLTIANAFIEICDMSEEDAFWLFTQFVKTYQIPYHSQEASFQAKVTENIRIMWRLVESHNEPLYKTIIALKVDMHACVRSWFETYFSNVLTSQGLEGVWDVLLGGAPGVLPYVGLALLLACRRKVEQARTAQQFLDIIQNIDNFVDLNAVANTSIDIWEKPVLESMPKEQRKLYSGQP